MKNETAATPETAICRRFEISDVSTSVLRVLQGASCLCCQQADGELESAGRACTVSSGGDTLWWEVRAHGRCLRAAGDAS